MLQLLVLYPQPTDVEKFEKDYKEHISLLHEKMGIPDNVKPYKIINFLSTPTGPAAFYQQFSMPFNSMEDLQAAMSSPAMQAIGADAQRISTGGLPVIMIGNEKE
jgi:uncharacterized protein (TIGR02118 family)